MHPAEFVRTLLAEGRSDVIVAMVQKTSEQLFRAHGDDVDRVYSFAFAFLIDVVRSLKALPPGATVDDDNVLSVWADVAYFGIKREDIRDHLEGEREEAQ